MPRSFEFYHIFSHKELSLLVIILLLLCALCITLGIHISKEPPSPTSISQETEPASLVESEKTPPVLEQDVYKYQENTQQAAAESLAKETQQAIEDTNIQLPHPVQLDLPK